ncbi:MAG: uracil-DNA glycosylase family protein [Saprospiraceae bacterium]|nr:uracil-DNA glycosylase family protein [Saprospiraceae bacterium]
MTSSLILNLQPKICKKSCKTCGLSVFQSPVYEQLRLADVFWVGLSAVKFKDEDEKLPLSSLTASGSLIHTIEQPFSHKMSFYKTNLVKCAPMEGGKLRYPLSYEMEKCFPNFQWELEKLEPTTVFLLGKQVASFVLKKLSPHKPLFSESFNYASFEIGPINFIPIHHPSYMLVYKRKNLKQYIENVRKHFPVKILLSLPV